MQRQGGNFLLQALLALALIIAFIPFFAGRLASRDKDAKMHAVTSQVETAQTAARIYLRENLSTLNYDTTTLSGDIFSDTLEPYGLPLGFIPRTTLNQNISLVINKNDTEIFAHLELSDGKLNTVQKAELVRRIGFYASENNGIIYVGIPLDEVFSDIVRRKDAHIDGNEFLSNLDMGNFSLENVGGIFARRGEFSSLQSNTLAVFGIENSKKIRNKLETLTSTKTVFQPANGETALSVMRGVLTADALSAKTISKFGDTGTFSATSAAVFDFSMTAGRTSFTGPAHWNIKGNLITDKINLTIERLEISSFINASRGQDVFINPDSFDYNTKSGIDVGTIYTSNITLRDQTSSALADGKTGAVVLDIRPAGTSVLPDVLLDQINNGSLLIIAKPDDASGKTVDCKSIISGLDGVYNQRSLAQNIICQYVFWQRLEKRIDMKKCLMDGKSDCK